MQQVRLASYQPLGWSAPAVTVGNFDGVHRGHQALVEIVVAEARSTGGTAVALSFDPHPSSVLVPDRAPATLVSIPQKQELLGSLGVERLVLVPFTRELSRQEPEAFAARVLRDCLAARLVVVGTGFRFGSGRRGNVALLQELGERWGIEVRGVEPVLHDGVAISSSRIREALARGALASVNAMLGRSYFVDGTVVRGDGRGRGLGYPTANLHVQGQSVPGSGVYAAWFRDQSDAGARARPAVVNIGHRPTFGGESRTVEAHVLDLTEDLYGHPVRLEFTARVRDERVFSGPETLAQQIRDDVSAVRRVLGE
jgi:riboflavin kinase/FMN adenylyltransferase